MFAASQFSACLTAKPTKQHLLCALDLNLRITLRKLFLESVRLRSLFAPNHNIPGQPTNQGNASKETVQESERQPPKETIDPLAQDSLPVAVRVGVYSVDQVILHEQQQGENPKFAMSDCLKIL